MPKINFSINPTPRVTRTEGDVALPVLWGEDGSHKSVVGGVIVTDTGLSADADGHKWLRPGTVLVPDTTPGTYKALAGSADTTPADGKADAVVNAAQVLVLKQLVDLQYGDGLVGAYYQGGFLGTNMPSVADNATRGLEASVKAAMRDRGYTFGEDFNAA